MGSRKWPPGYELSDVENVICSVIFEALDTAIVPLTAPELLAYVHGRDAKLRATVVFDTLDCLVADDIVRCVTLQPHCVVYYRSFARWTELYANTCNH